jgi:hypothetical protein
MMRRVLIAGAASALLMAGCANNSANMRVGTDMSYLSLKDQREASLTVREYPVMPSGAVKIGTVDASRCHRNSLQAQPTDVEIRADLKVAAYARGADGITDIQIELSSGLLQNCWAIINGTASAIALKK